MSKQPSRGFTLIELMITVAIVGILASVAYPSYRDSFLKSRRAEARAAIAEVMQQQERHLAQNNVYREFTETSPGPFKYFAGDKEATSPYTLFASQCGTVDLRLCIRVSAQPRHDDPAVGVLWMESTGAKGCSGDPDHGKGCWK